MIFRQNWRQLSCIQISGAICLPVILVGQTLTQTYGFLAAVLSICIGNGVLLLLGIISSKMSYEKGKTTMENATEYFGKKGVSFFALAMALSLLGWFAIQLNMMSLSVLDLLSIHSSSLVWPTFSNIILGLIITVATLWGIKGIGILANLSTPLLLATLAYALFTRGEVAPHADRPFSLQGISLVIAMAIGVVVDLPTYFRHAKTARDGWISILILFGLAHPLLEISGVYLASTTGGETILEIFKRHNSTLWNLWVVLFIILTGWTTNNLNLYSGVSCLELLWTRLSEKARTWTFGLMGTGLACFDLLNHLEIVLEIMGVLISSMGAVIITRYLMLQLRGPEVLPQDYRSHLWAWTIGIGLGFLSMGGISLVSISVLDATLGASLGTLIFLMRKKFYEKAYN